MPESKLTLKRLEVLASFEKLGVGDRSWVTSQIVGSDSKFQLPERPDLDTRKQLFLDNYKVKIDLEENTVSFQRTLGYDHIGLINEADLLAKELYKLSVIGAHRMKRWERLPGFLGSTKTESEPLTICGYIKESETFGPAWQDRKAFNNVCFRDLVVAHAFYLVKTGEDFFKGHPVRTQSGAVLKYRKYGLVYSKNDINYDKAKVAACRLI